MSLITQCPACNTMFRVVPDQLRISGGWVRCGNCSEVFDANTRMRPVPDSEPARLTELSSDASAAPGKAAVDVDLSLAPSPVASPTPTPSPLSVPAASRDAAAPAARPSPVVADDRAHARASVAAPEVVPRNAAPAPDSVPAPVSAKTGSKRSRVAAAAAAAQAAATSVRPKVVATPTTEPDFAVTRVSDPFDALQGEAPSLAELAGMTERVNVYALDDVVSSPAALGSLRATLPPASPSGAASVSAPASVSEPAPPEPPSARKRRKSRAPAEFSFMRKDAPDGSGSFWQRPVVQWLSAGACVLLAVLLGGQVVAQERDRIAALQPGLEPLLATFCGAVGCKITPYQQIDSLQIDSSAFAKVRADTYRLSFTLRNAAALAVAVPAVELTLTDSQDQVVLRRVLLTSDYPVTQSTIAAGADLSIMLPIGVKAGGGVEKFTGYRLLAFYP